MVTVPNQLCLLLIETSTTQSSGINLQGLAGRQQMRSVRLQITNHIHSRKGVIVRSEGELILASFVDPKAALDAAVAISKQFPALDFDIAAVPIAVTQVLAFGELKYSEGSFNGLCLDSAHHIMNNSQPGQMLADIGLVMALENDPAVAVKFRLINPKEPADGYLTVLDEGLDIDAEEAAPQPVLVPEPAEDTRVTYSNRVLLPQNADTHVQDRPVLHIKLGEHERRFGLKGHVITFGRAKDNDIVVQDQHVSRYHARIETGAEGPVLVNLGVNSSCIRVDPRKQEFEVEDKLPLEKSGSFGLAPTMALAEGIVFNYTVSD